MKNISKSTLEEGKIATVVRGGVKVTFKEKGGVDVYGSAPVTVHAAAYEGTAPTTEAKPEIGDVMPDGTIFAGVSPETGKNMFVTPRDASGTLKWEAAMKYAADLDANGHKDWKLPTKAEFDVLYQYRDMGALKGTFDESSSGIAGWYWSSTELPDDSDGAWMHRFSDGDRLWGWKDNGAAVRPVRSEPRP